MSNLGVWWPTKIVSSCFMATDCGPGRFINYAFNYYNGESGFYFDHNVY